jgi:hypothetical protein
MTLLLLQASYMEALVGSMVARTSVINDALFRGSDFSDLTDYQAAPPPVPTPFPASTEADVRELMRPWGDLICRTGWWRFLSIFRS